MPNRENIQPGEPLRLNDDRDLEYPQPKPPCEECRAPFGFPHRDGCNGQFWEDFVGGPRRTRQEAEYPGRTDA